MVSSQPSIPLVPRDVMPTRGHGTLDPDPGSWIPGTLPGAWNLKDGMADHTCLFHLNLRFGQEEFPVKVTLLLLPFGLQLSHLFLQVHQLLAKLCDLEEGYGGSVRAGEEHAPLSLHRPRLSLVTSLSCRLASPSHPRLSSRELHHLLLILLLHGPEMLVPLLVHIQQLWAGRYWGYKRDQGRTDGQIPTECPGFPSAQSSFETKLQSRLPQSPIGQVLPAAPPLSPAAHHLARKATGNTEAWRELL